MRDPCKKSPALSSSGLAANSTTGLRTSAADKPKFRIAPKRFATDRAGAYRRRDGYCRVIHHTNQMEKAGPAGKAGAGHNFKEQTDSDRNIAADARPQDPSA